MAVINAIQFDSPRDASWHYQVDDIQVIQSFEDNAQCWYATYRHGPGNLDSNRNRIVY